MSEPEFDHDDPDAKSMFDFLAEEGAEKNRRKKRAAEASERPLPIIRKPVPVSKSGPLLPPKPGAPVEAPPGLTDGTMNVDDDLGFLDDMPETFPDGQPRRSVSETSDSDSNIRRLDPRSRRKRGERKRTAAPEPGRVSNAPAPRNNEYGDLDLDLDDAPEFNRTRKGAQIVADENYYDDDTTPRRGRWLLLALVLIAAGAGSFLFANPDSWRTLAQRFGMDVGNSTVAEDSSVVDSDNNPLVEDGGEVSSTPSPMMQRFSDQLILVEGLVADGALDDAEQALSSMDRTVYGYGASEFGDLESRIEQLRSGVVVADPAVEQAERDEADRIAAEQATQAENERVAAAEQAAREAEAGAAAAQAQRDEQARVAAQAAREEEARIAAAAEQAAQEEMTRQAAAEQSAREEQARVAAQQVAQEEQQARLNAENARLEQARQVEQERLAAIAARTSDWPSVQEDRQATDRRIAEERAAIQRQQAREQRLIEAREREEALAAQAASQRPAEVSDQAVVSRGTADNSQATAANSVNNVVIPASKTQAIGDDELQTVYRRFIDLQQAVSSRDINAVVGLTKRSGVRVQQLMQIFENSTQIDARIRNVSTSNATGQIKGTLQINRIKRADGTFVEPPAALSSIPLSSEREGDGWSAISW